MKMNIRKRCLMVCLFSGSIPEMIFTAAVLTWYPEYMQNNNAFKALNTSSCTNTHPWFFTILPPNSYDKRTAKY
jgi:hypothetical protein